MSDEQPTPKREPARYKFDIGQVVRPLQSRYPALPHDRLPCRIMERWTDEQGDTMYRVHWFTERDATSIMHETSLEAENQQ